MLSVSDEAGWTWTAINRSAMKAANPPRISVMAIKLLLTMTVNSSYFTP
jgi:hypothetical protein